MKFRIENWLSIDFMGYAFTILGFTVGMPIFLIGFFMQSTKIMRIGLCFFIPGFLLIIFLVIIVIPYLAICNVIDWFKRSR